MTPLGQPCQSARGRDLRWVRARLLRRDRLRAPSRTFVRIAIVTTTTCTAHAPPPLASRLVGVVVSCRTQTGVCYSIDSSSTMCPEWLNGATDTNGVGGLVPGRVPARGFESHHRAAAFFVADPQQSARPATHRNRLACFGRRGGCCVSGEFGVCTDTHLAAFTLLHPPRHVRHKPPLTCGYTGNRRSCRCLESGSSPPSDTDSNTQEPTGRWYIYGTLAFRRLRTVPPQPKRPPPHCAGWRPRRLRRSHHE